MPVSLRKAVETVNITLITGGCSSEKERQDVIQLMRALGSIKLRASQG